MDAYSHSYIGGVFTDLWNFPESADGVYPGNCKRGIVKHKRKAVMRIDKQ